MSTLPPLALVCEPTDDGTVRASIPGPRDAVVETWEHPGTVAVEVSR